MPKSPISSMTAQEFIEFKGALGLNRKQMAEALDRSGPSVTGYENGKPIPVEIAQRIQQLIREEAERIRHRSNQLIDLAAGVGSMIIWQNEHKPREAPNTEGRFYRRQGEQDTRTYPVYRMSVERFKVYAEALLLWRNRVVELAREHTDEARQRDYHLELADLKAMAASAPRNAPYDVCIQRNEWDVVSRALRHYGTQSKAHYRAGHALRTHWLKHRGSGYLGHRKVPAPADASLKT